MSTYSELYSLQFLNLAGKVCRLLIEAEDREASMGTTNTLTGQHSPIQITYDTASDDIFAPVNGSRAVLKLVATSNFQFRNLYTMDAHLFRVSQYITDGSETLYWRGFINQQQFSSVYNQAPNLSTIVASDQLGRLKTIDWDREDPETELSALGAILDETGLDFDLYEAINIYESHYDSGSADSPLSQTYINPKVFKGKTYYDALEQILTKYRAIIKQDRGTWVIYRPEDCGAAYVRRYYTFASGVFTYSSYGTYNPVVDTTPANTPFSSIVRISNESPNLTISPAWKKYNITQNYGKIENLLENGDFSEWSGSSPDIWKKQGTLTQYYQEDEGIVVKSEDDSAGPPGGSFYQDIFNISSPRFHFNLEWEVSVEAGSVIYVWVYVVGWLEGLGAPRYANFEERVWAISGGGFYREYDNSEGSEILTVSDSIDWYDSGVSIKVFDKLTVDLYTPTGDNSNNYVKWKNVAINIMHQTGTNNSIDYAESLEHDVEIDPNNIKEGTSYEIMLNDLIPLLPHYVAESVYYGGMWRDSDLKLPTEDWISPQGSGPLIDLFKASVSWHYLHPTEILKVTIYSELLYSSSVIREVSAGTNRLYMIKKATWDVRYCKWVIEAYETGQKFDALEDSSGELVDEHGDVLHDLVID